MKKRFLIIAALIGLLASCPNSGGKQPVDPENPEHKTFIVFDNTQGICAVSVYDDYRRRDEDKIVDIPAGWLSAKIGHNSGESVPFYFLYRVNLKGINGFTLNYVPEIGRDQKQVRIDADVTTTIKIPTLSESISSPDTLLSDKSYLLIQNNSSYSFQLHRGSSIITPDNSAAALVNSGERAQYTINPGATSQYQLLVGADYKAFPGSIVSFEAGRVYSFVFDVNVSLIMEIEIKLENVAGIPQNSSGPDAPGAPEVTAGDSFLTLRWPAIQSAENYEVYVSTAQQPPASPVKTIAGTTTVLTGLVNETVYYVWIKAVNSSGSSDFSPRVRGIPWSNNKVPAVPRTPIIIPGTNQLTVNWEECGGAVSYEVYINTYTTRPDAPEITTDKTSAVIKNLENDKIYYIWVRAVNNVGKSDYSPLESGTPTIPTVAPVSPTRPVLTEGNRELTVSWQAVELAAAYEVWLGTSDNASQAQKQGGDITGGITETVINGLINETTYYVWVKAKNIVGTSGFSQPVNAKPSAFAVLPETPDVPAVVPGSRALSVSWQPVEGALSYEVWTSETNNPANAQKHGADISGTSVTLTILVNDTTYYLWVRAKNNIGASEFSPQASGTPSAFASAPSAPQVAPTVTAGYARLSVSWQEVEGANVYEVWVGTSTNPTEAIKRSDDVEGLSAVITDLINGTEYYVWIKAKNTVGISSFSPMAKETPSAYTIAPQTPAAPSVSIGNGQITVTWTAVEGAMAYEVWMGTANNSASASKNGADISTSLSTTISSLTNGTTYYIWLKAKNNIGTSGFSSVASVKPIANAAVPIITAGNGQLSLTWAAMTGADQYEIFCGTGINPPQSATQTVTSLSATIIGLDNGTTYNVWVRGKNTTGSGTMSNPANAKPVGNMGAVTLTTGGSGELVLSWPSVAGADQYDVYFNNTNSIPGLSSQTVSITTATISNLTNGITYYVWVKPKNANGTGAVNTVISGEPIATPGNLTVSVGNQQITVSWATVYRASSYEVFYSTTTTIPVAASFTVTGQNKTITDLTNGITYNFWVKAVNTTGTGEASPMASGKPIGNMGAVTLVSGNGQITASWSTVDGADQYEVYYSTTSTMPASPSQTVSTTTATFNGLINGTTYYVWVKPKNANGVGNTSTAVSGKPLLITPGTPGAPTVSPGYNQLLVTWTAVAGAEQYEVYYGTGTPTTLAATTTSTTTTITGLTAGITYYVCLRAKNASGVSGYGSTASGSTQSCELYRGVEKIGTHNITSALSWISTNAVSGNEFSIVFGANDSVSPKALEYSGKTVKITLLGSGSERTITLNSNGSMFIVETGVTLTLDENITLVGSSSNNASLVRVNGGILTINDGAKITNNNANSYQLNFGGGVYLENGTITMNGGVISENTALYNGWGGGIYLKNGTFIMNGGIICKNKASYTGGGINIGENGTFILNGGKIIGNTAGTGGGGVLVGSSSIGGSTFIMYGGTIYGNSFSSPNNYCYGGGVCVNNYGGSTFKKVLPNGGQNSGIIYGSEAVGIDADGIPLRNTGTDGHTVYVSSFQYRNTTAGETDQIDTTTGKGLSGNGNPPFGP